MPTAQQTYCTCRASSINDINPRSSIKTCYANIHIAITNGLDGVSTTCARVFVGVIALEATPPPGNIACHTVGIRASSHVQGIVTTTTNDGVRTFCTGNGVITITAINHDVCAFKSHFAEIKGIGLPTAQQTYCACRTSSINDINSRSSIKIA